MHTAFDTVEASYFNENDLEKIHINMRDGAMLKVITAILPHIFRVPKIDLILPDLVSAKEEIRWKRVHRNVSK